jgi:hypothetical protein
MNFDIRERIVVLRFRVVKARDARLISKDLSRLSSLNSVTSAGRNT